MEAVEEMTLPIRTLDVKPMLPEPIQTINELAEISGSFGTPMRKPFLQDHEPGPLGRDKGKPCRTSESA